MRRVLGWLTAVRSWRAAIHPYTHCVCVYLQLYSGHDCLHFKTFNFCQPTWNPPYMVYVSVYLYYIIIWLCVLSRSLSYAPFINGYSFTYPPVDSINMFIVPLKASSYPPWIHSNLGWHSRVIKLHCGQQIKERCLLTYHMLAKH